MDVWIRRDINSQLWLTTKEPSHDPTLDLYMPTIGSKLIRIDSTLFSEEELPKGKPVKFNLKKMEE